MDLSHHIKRSEGVTRKQPSALQPYPIKKKCMQCSKELVNDGSHLYYQRFCSQLCKEMYIEISREAGR